MSTAADLLRPEPRDDPCPLITDRLLQRGYGHVRVRSSKGAR